MQRSVRIDYMKAIGIFFVILAHTALYEPLKNWIYVFHMPLFFFISGYLFTFDNHPSFGKFVRKRFEQLLVPYMWFNIITYLLWLLILRHMGAESDMNIAWWSPAVNALLGNGDRMVHDVPLWFLLCLYLVEVFYYICYKRCYYRRQWLTIAFFFIGGAVYYLCPIRLPFSLGTALVAIVFYSVGNMARTVRFQHKIPVSLFIIFTLLITVAVSSINGRINMHINYYHNYLLFFVGGFAGIGLMYCFCGLFRRSAVVQYISNNTLTVCGIHLTTFAVIKGLMVYLLGISPSILSGSVLYNFIFSLISLAMSLGIAWLINRYLPFLKGLYKY